MLKTYHILMRLKTVQEDNGEKTILINGDDDDDEEEHLGSIDSLGEGGDLIARELSYSV